MHAAQYSVLLIVSTLLAQYQRVGRTRICDGVRTNQSK